MKLRNRLAVLLGALVMVSGYAVVSRLPVTARTGDRVVRVTLRLTWRPPDETERVTYWLDGRSNGPGLYRLKPYAEWSRQVSVPEGTVVALGGAPVKASSHRGSECWLTGTEEIDHQAVPGGEDVYCEGVAR